MRPHGEAPAGRRRLSRRRFLADVTRLGVGGAVAVRLPLRPVAALGGSSPLSPRERRTLDATLERMIPAEHPQDWSAADVGAGDYIERLLSGPARLYAGGPYRRDFRRFLRLSGAKRRGWIRELRRLRRLYREGLAELDRRGGGDFAVATPEARDAILLSLDLEGSPFFAALYAHTMEGVYAHPVYGGNRGYRAWRDLGYDGDVHGVRFPGVGSTAAPWNVYGGYAPQEMARPGERP